MNFYHIPAVLRLLLPDSLPTVSSPVCVSNNVIDVMPH